MGFFSSGTKSEKRASKSAIDPKVLHQLECRACPLNNAKVKHPKLLPTGPEDALLYFLGEAPDVADDQSGEHFSGRGGDLLFPLIPNQLKRSIRWNYVIRTHPPRNRHPEPIEIECCRPFNIRDIEATKSKAIVGFGAVALRWILGWHAPIHLMRGRRIPVQIGNHVCWYYPVDDPYDLIEQRKKVRDFHGREREIPSLDEEAFSRDLKRIFDEVDHLPIPKPFLQSEANKNLTLITGHKSDDFRFLMDFLERARWVDYSGNDIETKRFRPYAEDAKILTIAISLSIDETIAFAWNHKDAGWSEAQRKSLKKAIISYLASHSHKVVHNLAFEMEWYAFFFGRHVLRDGKWECTLAQAAALDERFSKQAKPGPLSLEWLVFENLGFDLKKLSNRLDKNNLEEERLTEVLEYNAMDAKFHLELFKRQEVRMMDCEIGVEEGYKVKLRQIPTCVLTQLRGINIDHQVTDALAEKYARKIEELENSLFDLDVIQEYKRRKGRNFNYASTHDVNELLKDYLHTDIGRKKNLKGEWTDNYSTDSDILTAINHPATRGIINLRHANKIKSTYIEPYQGTWPDGLIHCQFNTNMTETGRISSSNPNMQNQIKRDKDAVEIRKQVISHHRVDEVLISLDFGQIEARVLAMASKDRVFCKALWERYDVHGEWCERIAKRAPNWVKEPMYEFKSDKKVFKRYRDLVKNQFVFPLFFGAGLYKISNELGIDRDVIKPEMDLFWNMFQGVAAWQKQLAKFYEKNGFVETLTGHHRRRYPLTYNAYINEPIQGTTAEIVMDSMNSLSMKADFEDDPHLQPILNIHDDLVFSIPRKRIDDYAEIIIDEMLKIRYDFINVPLVVEMQQGKNWAEMKGAGEYWSDQWLNQPIRAREFS